MCLRGEMFPFFFFNDTATTEIYTLSLHDALPISEATRSLSALAKMPRYRSKENLTSAAVTGSPVWNLDRKSTRLNSSHSQISYAVFCLKKKKRSRLLQRHARQFRAGSSNDSRCRS